MVEAFGAVGGDGRLGGMGRLSGDIELIAVVMAVGSW